MTRNKQNRTRPGRQTQSGHSTVAELRAGILVLAGLLAGCAAAPPRQPQTLGDIDVPLTPARVAPQALQTPQVPKAVRAADAIPPESSGTATTTADMPTATLATHSREAVKQAWYEFIENASPDDVQHALAVRRLAELELSAELADGTQSAGSQEEFEARARHVIAMLQESLARFPDASGNDESLYQLAKAHDQLGEGDAAVGVLRDLVTRYPRSLYFAEAQFRIAESAFVRSDYAAAEAAYAEVLNNRHRAAFEEKALFKRGWSRFKQQDYLLALEDYMAAANLSPQVEEQSPSQRALYEEHLRAIGLTFIQLGGAGALREFYGSPAGGASTGRQLEYPVYLAVSNLLAEQQRPSDAVEVLRDYQQRYPASVQAVQVALRRVDIWKDAGFFNQYRDAVDGVYLEFQPQAPYWTQVQTDPGEKAALLETLRRYTLQLGSHFHAQFKKSSNQQDFIHAERWYARFLQSFAAYARQEKIYPLLAELHRRNGQPEQALLYHERAAFDGELVLNKESAYACLQLTDQLHQTGAVAGRDTWLQKHLVYAQRFAELYPADPVTSDVIRHAVQLASTHQQLDTLVELATLLPDGTATAVRHEVNLLKGQALFDLARYEEAEVVYQDLLADLQLHPEGQSQNDSHTTSYITSYTTAKHRWALSVYKQGEVARSQARVAHAHQQFLKVYQQMPESSLAPRAVYDAVALLMQERQWAQAISYLEAFQKEYSRHELIRDVDKLLSDAYLEADRPMDAAMNLEQLAESAEDPEEKRAALWRAAELYYSGSETGERSTNNNPATGALNKSDSTAALRAWQNYSERYPRPFEANMEAMAKVTQIFGEIRNESQRAIWLKKILAADAQAAASARTEATQFIAANAAFELAQAKLREFDQVRLVHPLSESLRRKKTTMQETTKLFGLASQYGHTRHITRATFEIGDMYRRFAISLLESEPPAELAADALEQYRFLLEDQAYPFEDKAIEFYEINVARIREGHFDEWVKQSLTQLSTLYPARYARHGKLETSIEQL